MANMGWQVFHELPQMQMCNLLRIGQVTWPVMNISPNLHMLPFYILYWTAKWKKLIWHANIYTLHHDILCTKLDSAILHGLLRVISDSSATPQNWIHLHFSPVTITASHKFTNINTGLFGPPEEMPYTQDATDRKIPSGQEWRKNRSKFVWFICLVSLYWWLTPSRCVVHFIFDSLLLFREYCECESPVLGGRYEQDYHAC